MIPQKTIETVQEHFSGICENPECGLSPLDPDGYMQQENLTGLIGLDQWEIDAGVWLDKNGYPNVGYRMCHMSEPNRNSVEHQAAEEQPHIQPADNCAGGSDLNAAIAFLRAELADGPLPGKVVYSDALSIGISRRTLERAKSQLTVITRRLGEHGKRGGGSWLWCLPADMHRLDGDLNSAGLESDLHRQLGGLGDINQNDTTHTESAISVGGLNEDIAILPTTGAAVDRREAILGMPVNAAIEIWRSKGSPVFTSRKGEQLRDLDLLLSDPDCQERYLLVIRSWLDHF